VGLVANDSTSQIENPLKTRRITAETAQPLGGSVTATRFGTMQVPIRLSNEALRQQTPKPPCRMSPNLPANPHPGLGVCFEREA
jgi:hypothetical protein